jgi:membrane protease YdiL (CAAX protease family)
MKERWNPLAACIFLLLMIGISIPLSILFHLAGPEWRSRTFDMILVKGMVHSSACLMLLIVYLPNESFADSLCKLGLTSKISSPFIRVLYFASGMAVGLISMLVIAPGFSLSLSTLRAHLTWRIPVLALNVVCEEIISRGYFYPPFRSKTSITISLAFIMVVVAFDHSIKMSQGFLTGIWILVLQVVLCLIRERSATLYPSLCAHLGYDIMLFLGF